MTGAVRAEVAPTDVEELRRTQQRQEEERKRQEQAPDVRLQKEEAPAISFDLPVETPCFPIDKVELAGGIPQELAWTREYLALYAGRCIGREGINLIAKRLSERLIARGYITTRVGVPEQELSSGTLTLMLVPGVIRTVRFSDEALYGSWRSAFPTGPGRILNLRDLEQGLEQMKRLPFQEVNFDIVPGEFPGESDVVIAVTRQKPWRLSLATDDAGSRSTGKLQGTATLSVDNIAGINDLFYISGNHDLTGQNNRHGTRGGSAYYSIPYGYWTASLFASQQEYHQLVQGVVEPFEYSGSNKSVEFTLQRVLLRQQNSKSALQLSIGKRQARTYLDDTEIEVQRRNVTTATIGLQHDHYIGQAKVVVSVSHRQGVPWFDAQRDPADAAPGSATTRYRIETADLQLNVPFTVGPLSMRYRNLSRLQYTQDRLLVADQFAIGNRYTVRGFDGDQTLQAERGWFVQNELALPILKSGQELYLGVDQGAVDGPSAQLLAGTELTGSVIGLRGGFKGFSYDLFAGWPLVKPKQLRSSQPAVGVMASYQF
jgi:hemolysin activation/secretion protein